MTFDNKKIKQDKKYVFLQRLKPLLYLQNLDTIKKEYRKPIQILYVSTFCLVINAFLFVFIFAQDSDKNWTQISIVLVECILHLLNLKILRALKYKIGRTLFFLMFFSIIFVYSNFLFIGEYAELYYFIIPLSAILFYKNLKIPFICFLLVLLFMFLPPSLLNIYPKEYYLRIHSLPYFIGIFIVILYLKRLNNSKEKELECANKQLKKQKELELTNLNLKLLKAQMNPHFMFNALNSIQNLVLKEQKFAAYEYLNKFSDLIRENLNRSEVTFICFEDEYSLLKKYLEFEQLRLDNKINIEETIDDSAKNIKIPSAIIQPFVENAIKHGLLHKERGEKKLKIHVEVQDILICSIYDNGIGFQQKNEQKKYNSFSTNAIKERLEMLKAVYQTDIGFEYQKVEQGTLVVIKIPYKQYD